MWGSWHRRNGARRKDSSDGIIAFQRQPPDKCVLSTGPLKRRLGSGQNASRLPVSPRYVGVSLGPATGHSALEAFADKVEKQLGLGVTTLRREMRDDSKATRDAIGTAHA
jgi:hypothetical protein